MSGRDARRGLVAACAWGRLAAQVWFSRVIAVLAAVLCLGGAPLRALAALADDAIAHCCCGPHAAADDCGCPHCPAAAGSHADDADHDQPADGTPRIGPCRLQGERATLVVFDLAITPPTHALPAAAPPGRATFPAPHQLVLGNAARPLAPPPRARA